MLLQRVKAEREQNASSNGTRGPRRRGQKPRTNRAHNRGRNTRRNLSKGLRAKKRGQSSIFSNSKNHEPRTIEEKLAQLPTLAQALHSDGVHQQLEAAAELRKLVSIEQNPPLQQVIDCGVVPRLLQLLDSPHHDLQFEAAWALTNLVSGTTDHTSHVIKNGAIPKFIKLLDSPSDDVKEQVVWALGNIGGDSPSCRDMVLSSGVMKPLLKMCNYSNTKQGQVDRQRAKQAKVEWRNPHADGTLTHSPDTMKLTLRRNLIWTISNLCRGKPQPEFNLLMPALPVIAWLLKCDDEEVLVDACWALSYLSDDHSETNMYIEAVVASGVVPRLVELLNHPSLPIQTPALRTIGNIVTGSDSQTSEVARCGALKALLKLLNHGNKGLRKEAVWAISNITAGTSSHIQAVIEEGIIEPLIQMIRTHPTDNDGKCPPFDIRKEAAWAVSNATSGGTDDQIRYLVSAGVIPALCELLDVQVPRVLDVALSGLENILKLGLKDMYFKKIIEPDGTESKTELPINRFAEMIEEAGGVDKIERLQSHPNDEVYLKAKHILEGYFIVESVEEFEVDKPVSPPGNPSPEYAEIEPIEGIDPLVNEGRRRLCEDIDRSGDDMDHKNSMNIKDLMTRLKELTMAELPKANAALLKMKDDIIDCLNALPTKPGSPGATTAEEIIEHLKELSSETLDKMQKLTVMDGYADVIRFMMDLGGHGTATAPELPPIPIPSLSAPSRPEGAKGSTKPTPATTPNGSDGQAGASRTESSRSEDSEPRNESGIAEAVAIRVSDTLRKESIRHPDKDNMLEVD